MNRNNKSGGKKKSNSEWREVREEAALPECDLPSEYGEMVT
jgi:hypothetical protein